MNKSIEVSNEIDSRNSDDGQEGKDQTGLIDIVKRQNRRRGIVGAVLAFGILGTTAAFAGPGFFRHGMGHGFGGDVADREEFINYKIEKLAKELELTREQKKEVDGLKERVLSRMRADQGAHERLREETKAILVVDKPSSDQLHALVNRESKRMSDHAHFFADALLELHAILTAEQRAELQEHLEHRFARANR